MARLIPPAAGLRLPAPLLQARSQALTQWQALGERERLAVTAVAAVLGLLLAWSLLLAPALRTVKAAPAELERLEQQLQQMRGHAAEARMLRAAPPVPAAQAQAALAAATTNLGPAARLTVTGDRAVVTLNGVPPEKLQAWLGEVRAAARARPVEAQLTRSVNGYAGTVALTLGGS